MYPRRRRGLECLRLFAQVRAAHLRHDNPRMSLFRVIVTLKLTPHLQ